MSARDDLNRYQQEWSRHLRWRKPGSHMAQKPGRYINLNGPMGSTVISLDDMPSELRHAVNQRLEAIVTNIVNDEHTKRLAELRARAIAEAQDTLDELTGPSGPKPILPEEPGKPVEAEA